MTTANTLLKRMNNFRFVKIDRDDAIQGWNHIAANMDSVFFEANRKELIEQKTLCGLMGHKANTNFRRHCMMERSAVRRAAMRHERRMAA